MLRLQTDLVPTLMARLKKRKVPRFCSMEENRGKRADRQPGRGAGLIPCGGKLPKAFERSDCPACRRLPLLDVRGESESSSAGPSGTDRPSWFRSEMAVAWPRRADWVLTVTASHPWRAHTVGSQVVPSHSRLVTAQWRWLLQGGSRDSEASTYPQPARMESCRQPSAHVHALGGAGQ